MKKLLKLSIFTVIFLTITLNISAQKANENKPGNGPEAKAKLPASNELFSKYVEALGGKSAAEKVKSRITSGTVELAAMNLKGTFEIAQKSPDKIYNLINLAGFGMILDGYDGTHAWTRNPIQGTRDKEGEELRQAQTVSDFNYNYNLEKFYPQAEVTGTEKIGEAEVYVVKADSETALYFDKKTGLLLRSDLVVSLPEGKSLVKTFFDEYRVVEGINQPVAFRTIVSGMEFFFKVSEIKQNVEIEDAKFSKPK